MDDVARNQQLTHVGVLLFGLTIYLFLVVISLYRLRGEIAPSGGRHMGWLGYTVAFLFATVSVVVGVVPDTSTPSAYETSRLQAAPIMLALVILFFVGYVCWASYELFTTAQWLRHGRPRPPVHEAVPRGLPPHRRFASESYRRARSKKK